MFWRVSAVKRPRDIFLFNISDVQYTELVFHNIIFKSKRLLFTHETDCIGIITRSFFASYYNEIDT